MKLYTIACDPTCGFKVTSHEEAETLDLAGQHVMKNHPDVTMSMEEAKAKVEVTEA